MALNRTRRATLARKGALFNDVDAAPFRARLSPLYARWTKELATKGWPLLGAGVGHLLQWFHSGSIEVVMATLTLKNIPDHLHSALKASAERNRRSLNSEILARLEQTPAHDARARGLGDFTKTLPRVDHRRVASFKRRGRP